MENMLRTFDDDYRNLRHKVLTLVIRQPKLMEPLIRTMTKGVNYLRKLFAPYNI